jgi:hypothetical protein
VKRGRVSGKGEVTAATAATWGATCLAGCPSSPNPPYTTGMCQIFPRIGMQNVVVVYTEPASPAGLGFMGRPDGPIPTCAHGLMNLVPALSGIVLALRMAG